MSNINNDTIIFDNEYTNTITLYDKSNCKNCNEILNIMNQNYKCSMCDCNYIGCNKCMKICINNKFELCYNILCSNCFDKQFGVCRHCPIRNQMTDGVMNRSENIFKMCVDSLLNNDIIEHKTEIIDSSLNDDILKLIPK